MSSAPTSRPSINTSIMTFSTKRSSIKQGIEFLNRERRFDSSRGHDVKRRSTAFFLLRDPCA